MPERPKPGEEGRDLLGRGLRLLNLERGGAKDRRRDLIERH